MFLFVLLIQCNNSVKNEIRLIKTKVELGEKLFFDPILSLDKTISCASCRKQELALDDTAHISLGVN